MRRGKEVYSIVWRITAGAACVWALALVAWGLFEGGGAGLETWAILSYAILDLGSLLAVANNHLCVQRAVTRMHMTHSDQRLHFKVDNGVCTEHSRHPTLL